MQPGALAHRRRRRSALSQPAGMRCSAGRRITAVYGNAKLAAFAHDALCFLVCCAAHVVLDEHAGELWDEHELRERMCIEREDPLQRSCLT